MHQPPKEDREGGWGVREGAVVAIAPTTTAVHNGNMIGETGPNILCLARAIVPG